MLVEIDGVDITNYIAYKGFKWQRSDIDASDSGRTMDAVMHRGRVATKIRLDITCRPLTSTEAQTVLTAVLPEYITVKYTDPMEGTEVTKQMYSNNNPASYLQHRPGMDDLWEGITFPLIEV